MTTNISQAALGPACASAESSHLLFLIHLDNSERVFLLAVLCEYELLLRQASRVFGYFDLDSRADIVRPLFEQLSGVPGQIWECDFRVESDSELSELHVALNAACELVSSFEGYDYDVACQLRNAILDKISSSGGSAEPDASSSVQEVQRTLPFDSVAPAPAPEPASVEPAAAPAESAFTDDEYKYLLECIRDDMRDVEYECFHPGACVKEADKEKSAFLQGIADSLMCYVAGSSVLSIDQRNYLVEHLRKTYTACKGAALLFLNVYERTEHDREGVWDNLRIMDLCLSLIGKLEKQYQIEEV